MPLRRSQIAAAVLAALPFAASAQQTKPPIANYWMDVATQNMSVPGMSGGMGGGMGGLMGGMLGGAMPGMGGPQKTLFLSLGSQRKNPNPEATHDIPPGQNMGPTLPLIIPQAVRREPGREAPEERTYEKPKARLLVYWGCSETVRPGQPRVADTDRMSPQQFAQALFGRSSPSRGNPHAAGRGVWPNERDSKQVPGNSSLVGDHLVKGNYTPDIPFKIGERQDFMAPIELSTAGQPSDTIRLEWKQVPTALGYLLVAMGNRDSTGEMIIWSSSELQDTGFGLLDYLPNDYVRKLVGEKVVLAPDVTRCAVPKGIFEGAEGASLQMIAYGEELNLVHPPRPADPKAVWEPIWTVKVRVKSTGMTMLGMDAGGDRAARRGSSTDEQRAPSQETSQPAPSDTPGDAVQEGIRSLRGILKF